MLDEEQSYPYTSDEIDLALEKAYRRGFHHALVLLATFYPRGASHAELTRLANQHLAWRRQLGPSRIADSAMPRYADDTSPLEREQRGKS